MRPAPFLLHVHNMRYLPVGFDDNGDQNEASRVNQETTEVAELMAQLHKRIVDEAGEADRGRELTMRDVCRPQRQNGRTFLQLFPGL